MTSHISCNRFRFCNEWTLDPVGVAARQRLLDDADAGLQRIASSMINSGSLPDPQARPLQATEIGNGQTPLIRTIQAQTQAVLRPVLQDVRDPSLYSNGEVKYVVDRTTNDLYLNETPGMIRLKGLGLFLFYLVLGMPFALVKMLSRVMEVTTTGTCENLGYHLFSWAIVILMIFAAAYTIFSPHNGRKVFGSLERLLNHGIQNPSYIGSCFQPFYYGNGGANSHAGHFFGGNVNTQNAL